MARNDVTRFALCTSIVLAAAACSVESPIGADLSPAFRPQVAAGSFSLGFFITGPSGLEPVTSLPVRSRELILGAHVADNTGAPARSGAVTFQYCSFKRLPPNDIERADEAPSANCADGSATWKNLVTVPVDNAGNAFMNFGLVIIPRTVGFRFKYSSRGSNVASGTSAPVDFTWTAEVS